MCGKALSLTKCIIVGKLTNIDAQQVPILQSDVWWVWLKPYGMLITSNPKKNPYTVFYAHTLMVFLTKEHHGTLYSLQNDFSATGLQQKYNFQNFNFSD